MSDLPEQICQPCHLFANNPSKKSSQGFQHNAKGLDGYRDVAWLLDRTAMTFDALDPSRCLVRDNMLSRKEEQPDSILSYVNTSLGHGSEIRD